MQLTVLGAGPAYTDRQGALGAAYLVASGSTHLLLDLGQGSFPAIFARVPPEKLDAVVISHLHPDHFIDLVPLRHYLRFQFDPPRRVRVIGPGALEARLDALHGQSGFAAQSLSIEPLRAGSLRVGDVELEARLVTHTDESYAVRATTGRDGPGLVYSGDCGRADDLAPLIQADDVLLAEASFGPGPVPPGAMHLDGHDVGRLAAATGAGRVLLTHLQMGFDPTEAVAAVAAHYRGPVEVVQPGSRIGI